MARVTEDGLTIEGYIERIDRAIATLQDKDAFVKYPAITRLLNGKAKKQTRRSRLIEVLEFIKKTVQKPGVTLEIGKNEATGKITTYKLSIAQSMLSEIWGITQKPVISLGYLFAGTMLLKRQTAKNQLTIEYSQARVKKQDNEAFSHNSQENTPIMYVYWVEKWTAKQLQAMEEKTQAWIDAGAPGKIDKAKAITIWGQPSADAISQSGAKKTQQQLLYEQWVIVAYNTIRRRTGAEIVTKKQMIQELSKHVTPYAIDEPTIEERAERLKAIYQLAEIQKTDAEIKAEAQEEHEQRLNQRLNTLPEKYWKAGIAQLQTEEGLDFKQLGKEEKKKYGIKAGTFWALIPCK